MADRDTVTSYARDVLAGVFVTGSLVRLACERHLRDLETGAARGLYFSAVEAQTAIDFWELCPHLKGKEAKRGGLLVLEPWQRFVIGSVYGWKRADHTRRFRVAWCEMGRKNGKSTLVYPAGLYALTIDGEEGAEVYSIATKRDQARVIFDLAKRAVTRSPDLAESLQTYAYSIVNESTFGKFEAQSSDADTLDGLNPSAALCDEIHKWSGRALWDVIETGMGAREQPLIWAITTAGDESDANVYGQEHDHTVLVLRGVVEDDARFGYIACLDPSDDWTDPANFVKANPNLGVSVNAVEIGEQVEKARRNPAAAASVKMLRLGLRSQGAAAWIMLPTWDACADPVLCNWERMKGFPCFGGLDLASTSDFAALSLCFPLTEDGEPAPDENNPAMWGYLFRLWMPREGSGHRGSKLREIATPWIERGFVDATEGEVIDGDRIEACIKAAAAHFSFIGLAYDPYNAATMANHLQVEGIQVHQFQQVMANYAEPVKLFDSELTAKTMRHDGNPAVRWMADNVTLVGNAAGHQMPSRKKSKSKIDAIAAGVMARARAAAGGGWSGSYHAVERL